MDPVDPFFSKFLAVSPSQVWTPQSCSEVNLPSLSFDFGPR